MSPGEKEPPVTTALSKADANAILLCAQRDGRHPRLDEALKFLGLSRSFFDRLMGEAKKTEGRRCGLEILTPSGHGTRSK